MNDEPISEKHGSALASFFSDVTFNFEALHAAHLHAQHGNAPVYFYLFGFKGSWSFPNLFEGEVKADFGGVSHLDDIQYFMRWEFVF